MESLLNQYWLCNSAIAKASAALGRARRFRESTEALILSMTERTYVYKVNKLRCLTLDEARKLSNEMKQPIDKVSVTMFHADGRFNDKHGLSPIPPELAKLIASYKDHEEEYGKCLDALKRAYGARLPVLDRILQEFPKRLYRDGTRRVNGDPRYFRGPGPGREEVVEYALFDRDGRLNDAWAYTVIAAEGGS